MICLHPNCPMGHGLSDWNAVANDQRIMARRSEIPTLVRNLNSLGALGVAGTSPTNNKELLIRLLLWCPCLFTQLSSKVTARAIVHLCEITLGDIINSANVY